MEIAKLFLEFWKASVWPIVLVTVVLVFRDQVRDALRRAKTIDAMGVNVELAEQVEDAQEALAEAQEEISHAPSSRAQQPNQVTISAQRALERVAEITRDRPSNRERWSRMHTDETMRTAVSLLTKACMVVGEEFGSPHTVSSSLASRLSAETGLRGWATVFDTAGLLRRITRRKDDGIKEGWAVIGRPPAPHRLGLGEQIKIASVAEGALNTLEDLLARAAQSVVEESERSEAL